MAGGAVVQTQAGPILLGPQGGAMDIPLQPGFSWAPVSGATEYSFTLATDAGLTDTVPGTPAMVTSPSFQVTEDLEYSTTYFWGVQVTEPTGGDLSIGTFTTVAEPEAVTYTCPQCGLIFDTPEALEAHIAAMHAPVAPTTPGYIWAIIGIGALLIIAMLVLIVRTRRVA